MILVRSKYILYFILFLTTLFASCSSDDSGPDPMDTIIPANLVVNIDILGSDSNNPYGNGSGIVNFNAQATNGVSYGYKINNGVEVMSSDGTYQYTFNSIEGVENHDITIVAYSSTNNSISNSEVIAVSYYEGTAPVWADEFFQDGAISSTKWSAEIIPPNNGSWWNNEEQHYTDRTENVFVSDGTLKIIAKKENYTFQNSTKEYTSARLKTQGKFDFTYGKVEVRAKLPSKSGTWPAIWLLGSNIDAVGWPQCGEMDIMEQTGWDKNKVLGTCHWYNTSSSSNASYGLDKSVSNTSSQFHVYTVEWNLNSIKIFVDNVEYYVLSSGSSSISNSPFEDDFFILLNVAMGGNLGGIIDSTFTEDTMEIDYVRVYQ